MLKFFHKPIYALAIEWARKRCPMLDAVTPLFHIDN